MTKIKTRLGISAPLFILVARFLGEVAHAADKVRISVSSLDVAFFTPAVALKRGFFKEEDIDAEVIRMNANISVTALATGDIDYTTIFGSVVRAAIRGLPVRVVASFLDSPTQMLLSRRRAGTAGRAGDHRRCGGANDVPVFRRRSRKGYENNRSGRRSSSLYRTEGRHRRCHRDLAASGCGRTKIRISRVGQSLRAVQLSLRRSGRQP